MRLTPAQRRIVDKMRDGWQYRVGRIRGKYRVARAIPGCVVIERERVSTSLDILVRKGIVVQMANGWRLAESIPVDGSVGEIV